MEAWEGVAVVGGLAALAYVVAKKLKADGVVSAGPPAGPPNAGRDLLDAASAYTGVPLNAVGAAAKGAPTWVKVAEFPVLTTSVAYDVITNPVGSAKAVGSGAKKAVTTVTGWFS